LSTKCLNELQNELRNPKLNPSSNQGKSSWYHYYAGYSPKFVKDVLKYLDLPSDAIVMDPWNGSGTTTQVAKDMGFSAIGYDINPVMVIVAKAKMFDTDDMPNLLNKLESILTTAESYGITPFAYNEPLEIWLTPNSAAIFRNLERAMQEQLIDDEYRVLYAEKSLTRISSLAAFFYTALFRTLRRFLDAFITSNPTWIKAPQTQNDKLSPSANQIYSMIEEQIFDMMKALKSPKNIDHSKSIQFQIERASSDSIPLLDQSINAVISSPPYCTRIDYAIATKPELALLGCSMDTDLKALRDHMIGTPTMLKAIPQVQSEWGPTCREFLDAVAAHQSKASKSYYLKYHLQYFDAIYRSLIEIERILAGSGYCTLVVQDSYYKEVHNDLPRIFTEMACSLGWDKLNQLDFNIKRTMAGCNQRAKKYRRHSKATESVLIFQKVN